MSNTVSIIAAAFGALLLSQRQGANGGQATGQGAGTGSRWSLFDDLFTDPLSGDWGNGHGVTMPNENVYRDPAQPRGIRNHNPGNIELGDSWQGLSARQTDGRFAQFDDPVYGIRALAKTIANYQRLYGINTIAGVIRRWAPGHENNTGAYIDAVAHETGISANAPIDLTSDAVLSRIVPAIIKHENGQQPYAYATIQRGIALA